MKDLLGATGDGLGGAAESRWRPDRILSKRAINLLGTAAAAAGVVLLGLNLLIPNNSVKPDTAWAGVPATPSASSAPAAGSPIAPPAGLPVSAPQTTVAVQDLRTYAIELTDLSGLPPDVTPGTSIELWATWNSEEGMPGFQKVIDRAFVERVAPPVVEGTSPVVLLQISRRELRDLLWADRYGSLGAVLLPQTPQTSYAPYLP